MIPLTAPQVRAVPPKVAPATRKKDLAALVDEALALGASQAKVIEKKDLVFLKNPAEPSDKTFVSAHFPANYPLDPVRQALKTYSKGLFLVMDAPAGMPDHGEGPVDNLDHRAFLTNLCQVVSVLEAKLFYMGYHLSLGLCTGHCRALFCADEKRCQALVRGRPCRHPYRARPSLAAMGLDAPTMARNLEWIESKAFWVPAGLVLMG